MLLNKINTIIFYGDETHSFLHTFFMFRTKNQFTHVSRKKNVDIHYFVFENFNLKNKIEKIFKYNKDFYVLS